MDPRFNADGSRQGAGPHGTHDVGYTAPIPPLADSRTIPGSATHGESSGGPSDSQSAPRYLRAEPMPPQSPFGAFGFPGPGRPGQPVRLPRKSLVLAGLLGAALGPLGMLYSTFFGAFIMMGVCFWVVFFAGLSAVPGLMLWCALWALWSAHRKNERRRMMETYLSQY